MEWLEFGRVDQSIGDYGPYTVRGTTVRDGDAEEFLTEVESEIILSVLFLITFEFAPWIWW